MPKMIDRYVVYYCRNSSCNNAWIDVDKTRATTYPPKWKFCEKCAHKYGHTGSPRKLSDKQQASVKKMIKANKQRQKEKQEKKGNV